MSGNYNTPRGEIVTTISLVFEGVAQENTPRRAWGKFVVGGGIKVWKTQTTKQAEMIIRGMGAVEKEVWRIVVDGTGGPSVEKVCGCV